MGIVSANDDVLAAYSFGSGTGTSSYHSIPAGNHYIVWTRGDDLWVSNSTSNFQAGYRYTIEYDGSGYRYIPDGAASAPQQNNIITDSALGQNVITIESIKRIENTISIKNVFGQ